MNSRISEPDKSRCELWTSVSELFNCGFSQRVCVKFDPLGLLFTLGCLRILIYVFYDPVWGSIRSVKLRSSEWLSVEPVLFVWRWQSFEKGWFRVRGYEVLTGWFYHSLSAFLSFAGEFWELGGGVGCRLGSSCFYFVACFSLHACTVFFACNCICFLTHVLWIF